MEDRTEVTKTKGKDGKESISYRKSWEKNGLNHSIEVRKVEGGYIITKSRYGTPDDSEEGKYIDERSEEVSTTNPFNRDENSDDQMMFGFIDNPTF